MERDMKNGMDSKTQTSKIIEWLEDLKSEDVKRRVISVGKLHEISAAFGPKKTRELILPFLIGETNLEFEDDDEEVLLELASQMEGLAHTLYTVNSVTSIVKYFKILFVYEDYSVINKVGFVTL
jgi:hypothetical protein